MRPDIHQIANHQRGSFQPTGAAQRAQVGRHVKIAVAACPVGQPITGHGLHLHVDGEQVVAAVCAVTCGSLQKELGVESLAHLPSVEVGEAEQHRVDLPILDFVAQLIDGKHSA